MQSNLPTRLAVIAVVMLLSIFVLVPNFWRGDFSLELKPGLDMSGGASLVYNIQVPEGERVDPELSSRVASALRERVDPDGVRNLIWRPQGPDRLEIQLPLGGATDEANKARDDFLALLNEVGAFNLDESTLLRVARFEDPTQLSAEIEKLARGSPRRTELLQQLVVASKARSAAHAQQSDPLAFFRANREVERIIADLRRTNLEADRLTTILDIRNTAIRDQRLREVREADPDFAERNRLLDRFVSVYGVWGKWKDRVDSVATLKALLKGSGVLSFHIVANPNDPKLPPGAIASFRQRLEREGPRFRASDELRWVRYDEPPNEREVIDWQNDPSMAQYNGEWYQLVWMTPDKSMINRDRDTANQWALTSSYAGTDPDNGQLVVHFEFDAVGARLFGDLTGAHDRGKPGSPYRLAAVLDDRILSSPNLHSRIGQSGVISGGSGGFTPSEVDYLVRTLSAGSLPARLEEEPARERFIGPQLGADNLARGLIACVAGVVVVAVFLVGYYFRSGAVAVLAVLLNIVLILAGMSAFGATFTLPGVAGIILTIGMAVDANVLIFERLREEQLRGLGIRVAIHNAYKRAFSAILDSNITTGISAMVLYFIGTEEVRGFGITLLLGILSSMFTALFVTRTVFIIMTEKFGVTRLSSLPLKYPKLDQAFKPDIDWMRLAPLFIAFSAVFILFGMGAFVWRWQQGQMLDIEFAGGTSVQLRLQQDTQLTEVRRLVEAAEARHPQGLPSPSLTSVGADLREYEVITPNTNSTEVAEILSDTFAGMLDTPPRLSFDISEARYEELEGRSILPILSDTQKVDGVVPDRLPDFVGGVAIVLRDVQPRIDLALIKQRIDQQRLAAGQQRVRSVYVTQIDATGAIVVLAADPFAPYEPGNSVAEQAWRDAVAGPTWDKIVNSLTRPSQFTSVSNIDRSVAGEAQNAALAALIVSVIGIVIYIWVRFGDVKYSNATIIAVAHDVLFTLAAIGFAHLLAEYVAFIADPLLIEPFRLNLTLVSAVLTVIGFSMNDTVVIFDRIRENRGKFGHVDSKIINDSINQTMSRTILTGGTTIVTLLVMYVLGGTAIHSFTFVMLAGFLTATYSSIAIAAPLLLIGQKEPVAAATAIKPATA